MPTDATNFTYAAWIVFDTINNAVIVANGNLNADGYEMLITGPILLSLGSDIGCFIFGVCFCKSVLSNLPVTLHQWHQTVLRRRAPNTFDFIIDTVLIATWTATFNPTNSGEDFSVGMDYTNGTNPFKGKIDDIAVYNRALSNSEISQLYHYNPSVISFTSGNDTTVCAGATVTLNGGASGGAWSSNNPPVATVSGTGVVTSVSSGTSIISYSTGVGCLGTETINVTAPPSIITGPANVCIRSAITLSSDAAAGGTWSSGSSGIATVTPATGELSPALPQVLPFITYTTGPGCLFCNRFNNGFHNSICYHRDCKCMCRISNNFERFSGRGHMEQQQHRAAATALLPVLLQRWYSYRRGNRYL